MEGNAQSVMAAKNECVQLSPAPLAQGPAMASPVMQSTMAYACQTCTRRKVKCDKTSPACSSCRKSRLECTWSAPPPPRRKRKMSDDVHEKLAHYERILHQHGLLEMDNNGAIPQVGSMSQSQQSPDAKDAAAGESRTGKLLAGQGKSRYFHSNLWRDLGDDAMRDMLEDEEEGPEDPSTVETMALDPLSGALLGAHQSTLRYHPAHAEAMILWRMHIENVEPVCKVLHIPSTRRMVEVVSQQPATASKADECLLFAIYHFAVFSMSEDECRQLLGEERNVLIDRYHFATRQALVNASFLRTTEISVLQALILFLLPCRFSYDPHTYWILTGVAIRIAQRMGLHRDAEKLGLSPFDVQMRRRLTYQLIPLDGVATQLSGTDVHVLIEGWDLSPVLNINDDQMWPGMTEKLEEQKGATEMIFCLARATIGKNLVSINKAMHGPGFWESREHAETERLISEIESIVEEKYIRYCDVINPLHYLTIGFARSALTSMRFRVRLPKVRNCHATEADRREMFQLTQTLIDTDTAISTHPGLQRFRWLTRSFFVWGSWDSLIYNLTSLRNPSLLSTEEIKSAWTRMEQVFSNHDLVGVNHALHRAAGRLALAAWEVNPQRKTTPEPSFISSLRAVEQRLLRDRQSRINSKAATADTASFATSSTGPSPDEGTAALFGDPNSGIGLDTPNSFDIDNMDWMFWDQLIRDYQSQQS